MFVTQNSLTNYSHDPITIQGDFDLSFPILNQIKSLTLNPNYTFFGNVFISLYNAFCLAKKLNIKYVYISKFSFFIKKTIDINGIIFNPTDLKKNDLESRFFYRYTLSHLYKDIDISYFEASKKLMPLLNFNIDKTTDGNKDLYIHFRCNEIFTTVRHPAYGQPPFDYYCKIITEEGPWDHIYLVYQDKNNPTIDKVVDFLKNKKINFTEQSSTLENDVNLLYKAKNLVMSRGTFAYPIICTSLNIKKIFIFEPHPYFYSLGLKGIEINKYVDSTGAYREILEKWDASPEQLDLMLNYVGAQKVIATES